MPSKSFLVSENEKSYFLWHIVYMFVYIHIYYVYTHSLCKCVVYITKLSAKELMLLICDVGEDSRESLELQGDPTSPS